MATPPDPAALFRDMLGQWEQMANQFGGQALKTGEFARAMQGASAATMRAQDTTHQVMDRTCRGQHAKPQRSDRPFRPARPH